MIELSAARARWAAVEVKAAMARLGAVEVCRRLRLDKPSVRTGSGLLVRCPWHGDREPSCKVDTAKGPLLAFCHACKRRGGALALIAAVHGLDVDTDDAEVIELGAALAGVDLGDVRSGAYVAPPARPAEPPRPPPPPVEVAALWTACGPVTRDPEVAAWLASRGLDAAAVESADLARALPADVATLGAAVESWLREPRYLDLDGGPEVLDSAAVAAHAANVLRAARFKGGREHSAPWCELGYRCVVPLFDAAGGLASVRARNVTGGVPKALPPSGWTAKGMVMANPLGRMVLALGAWPWWAEHKVVICEGEPDWMAWSTQKSCSRNVVVLGLGGSGAWSSEIALRVPAGSRVVIRTDPDPAGDDYAATIAASFQGLCTVVETWPGERAARRAAAERERAQRTTKGRASA